MTATPIPRTVTMTLFGDLDVSTLDGAPPGRQKVNTYLPTEDERQRWWEFFGKKLVEGRQGYVVTPLVDESETIAAKSLEESYEALANGPLEAFRLGLVHGRMKPEEKDAIMAEFRSGEIQVLVSTSVVEVGVDVPNATLMTIESGQRFGLAQLHQLRGRISRGQVPRLLRRICRRSKRRSRRSAEGLVFDDRRVQVGRGRFLTPGPRGTVRHSPARPAALPRCRPAARRNCRRRSPPRRPANGRLRPRPGLSHPRPPPPHDAGSLRESAGVGRRWVGAGCAKALFEIQKRLARRRGGRR